MRFLPVIGACLMLVAAGCGTQFTDSGDYDDEGTLSSRLEGEPGFPGPCDPDRILEIQIIAGSTELLRDLPDADLRAGDFVPELDLTPFDLRADHTVAVVERVRALTAERLEPLGVLVTSDATPRLHGDVAEKQIETGRARELISRVVLTQIPGVPEHCGCQAATGQLGLPSDGPAEGVVFVNAYVQNGLAGALARYDASERMEKLAVAIANSALHEAGHTLGLVHLDVPGQPVYIMARGGAAAKKTSLLALTTLQQFSDAPLAVTADARSVREAQCDACVVEDALALRRSCAD